MIMTTTTMFSFAMDVPGNPYIKDKLTRLAEDGSKKMANTLKEAVSSTIE